MDMDMEMASTTMATSIVTTATAALASSSTTAHATSMDGMAMSSSSSSAAGMDMTFFFSNSTPLFSRAWQPTNTASYAASCIFLVALAALLRVLLAVRPSLDEARREQAHASDVTAHQLLPGGDVGDGPGVMEQARKDGVLPPRPEPLRRGSGRARGLRVAVQAAMRKPMVGRACHAAYEVVVAGIGYLLMLAVMSYNVGYFLSVLAGIFLGAFAMANVGGHAKGDQWETC